MMKSRSASATVAAMIACLVYAWFGCAKHADTDQQPRAKTAETRSLRIALQPAGGAAATFTLEQDGQVSAGAYDASGTLVRELLHAKPMKAGEHTVTWDGLDRKGRPMPPGKYEIRVLRTPGFTAHYVTSIGINPDSAPYDKWVGNHGGAASVAADKTGMYVAAQVTETAPVLLKQSLDGRTRHWTRGRGDVTKGRYQGGASLAADGLGRLYMLQQNGYLQVIDAEKGTRIATWDVLPKGKKRNAQESNQFYHHRAHVAPADLAARGETVVVSYREQESLRWLNPKDGSTAAEVKLAAPSGLAVGPEGNVYVIAEDRVLTVTPEGKTEQVIADGLTAPRRIDVTEGGDLLISEGAPSHQVKLYAASGELKAVYGRRGGRLDGHYKPENFRDITDVTADADGGFLVAEPGPAPRRVARFSADGKLIDEWYGGQPYYAWAEPLPHDPSKVWFNPGSWLTLAEVDYENGGWRVLENYEIETLAGGLVHALRGHAGRWRVVYREDKRYLVSTGEPQVLAHGNGTLRAVTVLGHRKATAKAAEMAGYKEEAGAFRWLDSNGDGKPQPDEFTFSESDAVTSGMWVADDWSVISAGNSETEDGRILFNIRRAQPTWVDGRPVYAIGEEKGLGEIVATVPCIGKTGYRGKGVYQSKAGDYYGHYNAGGAPHGSTWPTYWGQVSRVVGWSKTGHLRFKAGRHAVHGGLGGRPHTTPPGRLHVPDGIIGEADNVIVVADRVETLAGAWTTDGLYAGSFFDHRPDDGLPDSVYYWWRTPEGEEAITTSDNAAGGRVFQRADGTVLWFVQGRNSVPTYTVTGWKDWQRWQAAFEMAAQPAHAAGEGTGLTARYFASTELTGDAVNTRVDKKVWHGVPRRTAGHNNVIDGFHQGPAYDWSRGVRPSGKLMHFAVRWTGEVEAPLSEAFKFSVYARGGARLWIGGQQRIFGWNECTERWETEPIQLQAGKRYPVQLDFYSTQPHPACSLNWESRSLDRDRIPQRHLYPETEAPAAEKPDKRPATTRVDARTFDAQSGQIGPRDVRGGIRGLRQRAFGVTDAWVAFRRIDFGDGATKLQLGASGTPAGDGKFPVTLAFRLAEPNGPTIAVVDVSKGDQPHTVAIEKLSGVRDIYVVNTTPKRWHFIRFYWFSFE